MATVEEVARVRQLTADTAAPQRLTDAELAQRITDGPTCPVPAGSPEGTVGAPDLFSVAALVWEDRALELELERAVAPVAEPARVTSERNGDVSRTYGGDGRVDGAPVTSPATMRAVAARLRKRSCNKPAAAKTVSVLGPAEDERRLDAFGFYDGQRVNG